MKDETNASMRETMASSGK